MSDWSQAQLIQNEELMEQLNKTWAERLSDTEQALKDQASVDDALVAKEEA